MRGRPRREATPHERSEIERLSAKYGIIAVAARLALPEWLVRREMEALNARRRPTRPWTSSEDSYISEHAGEMTAKRLRDDLWKLGHQRTVRAVHERVITLLTLGVRELRLELTVTQVALLIGRHEHHVEHEIQRKALRAHKSVGAWRVHASDLRVYVLDSKRRVNWQRCELDELCDLLARRWGTSDDAEKKARAKAKAVGNG